MSDTDRFGSEVVTAKDQIEGTWTIDGETYDLITEDTTKGTLELIEEYMQLANQVAMAESEDDIPDGLGEDLDNFPWEDDGDDDKDVIESVVDGKLIQPEVDVQNTPVRKLRSLFEGMMQTWGEGKQVADARDQMPLDEGNR